MKKSATKGETALKDLSVKNAKAQDVSGGITLAYTGLEVSYQPQKPDGTK
ncbi:MAG TPA: hypothetical protein VFL90_18615 [Methylomirabilota bacterium]|nr:hypothetical protein [Methylomirabilota bacterium]